jgi:hypothetical protein
MKKNILLLLLVLPTVFCHGQKRIVVKPDAKFIASFPFRQFSGGVMVVKALLDNTTDSLNFILDTGSGGISLDSATCVALGLRGIPSDTTIVGMGQSHKVSFVFNQTLHFPNLDIQNLDFHINDYSILSSVYGEKIDGLIGHSFFCRYIVKIDFDSLRIYVYPPGKIKYPEGGDLLKPVFNGIPRQSLQLKDARKISSDFYFDTGAGLCFLMSENLAIDSTVLSASHRPVVTEAEGMGGKLQMRLTVLRQLQVGRYKFRDVPTYIYKDDYNVTSYPDVGGLLGSDLLRRFNLIINYPDSQIYVLPNSHFKDVFDYSYTGLSMYYIEGRIIVDDIIAGSPAEKAGLHNGDILLAIEKNVSNNIQQYKSLLQYTNQKTKLFVSRNGTPLMLVIKPQVIK